MTAENTPDGGPQPEGEYEAPVINDKRKIDPETGKARSTQGASPGTVPDDAARAQGTEPDPGTVPDGEAGAAGTVPGGDEAREEAGEDPLDTARVEAVELADQLARRNADLYNLQQEYNGYVRRSKAAAGEQRATGQADVVESLLGVLDEIDLARQHGDLTGPLGAIVEKVESALAQRFSVERFGAQGEEFDPELHDALMSTPDAEATTSTIAQVMQSGYRMGEKVLRAARVAVSSPQ